MQLANALIELESFERITEWIPQLYRTDARFDISKPSFINGQPLMQLRDMIVLYHFIE